MRCTPVNSFFDPSDTVVQAPPRPAAAARAPGMPVAVAHGASSTSPASYVPPHRRHNLPPQPQRLPPLTAKPREPAKHKMRCLQSAGFWNAQIHRAWGSPYIYLVKIFEAMKEAGATPNLQTYALLIRAGFYNSPMNSRQLGTLYKALRDQDLIPTPHVAVHLLGAARQAAHLPTAETIFDDLEKLHIKLPLHAVKRYKIWHKLFGQHTAPPRRGAKY